MTEIKRPKPTPKQAVLATFAAIRKLLSDDEMPAEVKLVQAEALAIYGAGKVAEIQELRKARREKKVSA